MKRVDGLYCLVSVIETLETVSSSLIGTNHSTDKIKKPDTFVTGFFNVDISLYN